MEDKRSLYRNKFDFFVNFFVACFSVALAVYAVYLTGGNEAMIQPLPPFVWLFIALAGISFLLAFYNGIMVLITPKDTRLDDLIKVVKELKQAIENRSSSNITIQTKIDTVDMTKMTSEQLTIIKEIIDSLQGKQPKEK